MLLSSLGQVLSTNHTVVGLVSELHLSVQTTEEEPKVVNIFC